MINVNIGDSNYNYVKTLYLLSCARLELTKLKYELGEINRAIKEYLNSRQKGYTYGI